MTTTFTSELGFSAPTRGLTVKMGIETSVPISTQTRDDMCELLKHAVLEILKAEDAMLGTTQQMGDLRGILSHMGEMFKTGVEPRKS